MVSLSTLVAVALAAAAAAALPASIRLTPRQLKYHSLAARQVGEAQAAGLGDVDLLQFALTLEHLEAKLYSIISQFSPQQFAAAGVTAQQRADILQIGKTEQAHVSSLTAAIATAGFRPVQPCTYDFGNATSVKDMLAMASVIENVGVSAYGGAGSLVLDRSILATAISIITVESRHQSVLRAATGLQAVPEPNDAPLSLRAVFTIAKPLIQSCPTGSNLNLQPFLGLQMAPGRDAAAMKPGSVMRVQVAAEDPSSRAAAANKAAPPLDASAATHCAFTSGAGTAFTPLARGQGCPVPDKLAGVVYLTLTSQQPPDNKTRDDITVAGPLPMLVS